MGNCCPENCCKQTTIVELNTGGCPHDGVVYRALCITPDCKWNNSDRRLCDWCLNDHSCSVRVSITQLINQDEYQLKPLFSLMKTTQDNEKQNKQKNEIGSKINTFEKHFLESLNSYQLFYRETLNALLLRQLPTEFANQFLEAARQIVVCKECMDFSLCGKEGRFVLVDTFRKPEEVKKLIQALNDCSKLISIILTEIEQKLKTKIKDWNTQVQGKAKLISNQLNQIKDQQSLDVSKYNYNLSSHIPTTSIVTTERILNRCPKHNEQFQVICCDKQCPASDDVRLCGGCLVNHPCNKDLRIRYYDYKDCQSLIIEAATLYIKKQEELDIANQKIKNIFDKILEDVSQCFKELKLLSEQSLNECYYQGVDENMRKKLLQSIENLYQIFDGKNSSQSLKLEEVQVIAYLVINSNIRDNLKTNNSEENIDKIRQQFLQQLEQVLHTNSQKLIDTLFKEDSLPQQNLSAMETSKNSNTNNSQRQQNSIQQQALSTTNNANIVIKTDQQLEDQLRNAMCRKALNDFGDDSDDYISHIVMYDGLLVASSHSGIVCAYQVESGFNRICRIVLDGTCFSICATKYQHWNVVLANREQLDSHAIICYTLQEDSKLLFTLEGHSGPILQIKLIDQLMMTCSGDSSIKLWDLKTLKQTKEVKVHTHQVRDVVEIRKNIIASCSFDETIKIYDLQNDKVVHEIKLSAYVYSLVMIQAQQCLAAASGDGSISLYSSDNYRLLATFQLGEVSITTMAMLGDSYLVLSQQNRKVQIVKLSDGNVITRIAKNVDYDGTPEAVYAYQNQIIYGDGNVIKVYA